MNRKEEHNAADDNILDLIRWNEQKHEKNKVQGGFPEFLELKTPHILMVGLYKRSMQDLDMELLE